MTNNVSKRRRRALSLSMPSMSSDPIAQLTRVIEIFHLVNRALPTTVLEREELITLGGLLAQVSGALLTLTDLLSASANTCGAAWAISPPALPQITPHRASHKAAPGSHAEGDGERRI
jgi:hypothetical protein